MGAGSDAACGKTGLDGSVAFGPVGIVVGRDDLHPQRRKATTASKSLITHPRSSRAALYRLELRRPGFLIAKYAWDLPGGGPTAASAGAVHATTPCTPGAPTADFSDPGILVSVATLAGFEPAISTLKGSLERPSQSEWIRRRPHCLRASSFIHHDFHRQLVTNASPGPGGAQGGHATTPCTLGAPTGKPPRTTMPTPGDVSPSRKRRFLGQRYTGGQRLALDSEVEVHGDSQPGRSEAERLDDPSQVGRCSLAPAPGRHGPVRRGPAVSGPRRGHCRSHQDRTGRRPRASHGRRPRRWRPRGVHTGHLGKVLPRSLLQHDGKGPRTTDERQPGALREGSPELLQIRDLLRQLRVGDAVPGGTETDLRSPLGSQHDPPHVGCGAAVAGLVCAVDVLRQLPEQGLRTEEHRC